MKLLACLLLVFCVAAAPRPLARIDPAQVDAITIDISVDGLGAADRYHVTLTRKDATSFASDDGKTVIAQADILPLVQALALPATQRFDFSRTWITPAVLRQNLDAIERHFLGPNRTNVKMEKAYRAIFLDWNALRNRCEHAMRQEMYVSDYYPSVDVTLTAGAQEVRIQTDSQREFVLPMSVSVGSTVQETWDPALAWGLYQMLPAKAPLRDVFAGGDVIASWASVATGYNGFTPCSTAVRPFAPY